MNSEWVLARIEEFLTLVREYDTAPSDTQENLASDCVKAMLPVMERIAARVEPDRPHQWHTSYPMPQ